MGILKSIFGEPGFAVEAGDNTTSDAADVAVAMPEPTVPDVGASASIVEGADVTTEGAPAKKSARKSKGKATAKASGSSPVATVAPNVDPVQALIDAALARTAPKPDDSNGVAKTFATDFLIAPPMKGRRRPGPSLAKFMDIADSIRR